MAGGCGKWRGDHLCIDVVLEVDGLEEEEEKKEKKEKKEKNGEKWGTAGERRRFGVFFVLRFLGGDGGERRLS